MNAVLVDTSVWINHFRHQPSAPVAALQFWLAEASPAFSMILTLTEALHDRP